MFTPWVIPLSVKRTVLCNSRIQNYSLLYPVGCVKLIWVANHVYLCFVTGNVHITWQRAMDTRLFIHHMLWGYKCFELPACLGFTMLYMIQICKGNLFCQESKSIVFVSIHVLQIYHSEVMFDNVWEYNLIGSCFCDIASWKCHKLGEIPLSGKLRTSNSVTSSTLPL